jgi:hypothetical protein
MKSVASIVPTWTCTSIDISIVVTLASVLNCSVTKPGPPVPTRTWPSASKAKPPTNSKALLPRIDGRASFAETSMRSRPSAWKSVIRSGSVWLSLSAA